jgi:hypothetical protein
MGYRHLTYVLATSVLTPLMAQTDLSVFSTTGRAAATTFVTDYQAIGINPANLGWAGRWPKKKLSIGLAEASFSAYSEALKREDLHASVLGRFNDLNQEQKTAAAKDFANAGVTVNVDIMSFGAAFRTDAFGGLGFQVRDRAQWNSVFGPLASDLLFMGSSSSYFDQLVLSSGDTIPNAIGLSQATVDQIVEGIRNGEPLTLSTLFKGTHVSFTWYREYDLSYGRSIIHNDALEFYAGVGLKYLSGIGILDLSTDASGTYTAFSALSPFFDVDYGKATLSTNATARNSFLPRAVGHGFGLELGLSAIIAQKWKVGASVTNIGSIKWEGNVYSANDAFVTSLISDGLDSYDVLDGIDDIVSENNTDSWQSEGSRSVALPTNVRLGAGLVLGDLAEVGADVVLPMNDEPGNYNKAVLGIGGDLRPVKWLQLSAGVVTGGDYDTKLPVGITFDVGQGTWEFGVASRDAITYFTENNPTVSLCVGFLRFRF